MREPNHGRYGSPSRGVRRSSDDDRAAADLDAADRRTGRRRSWARPGAAAEAFDTAIRLRTGFHLDELSPLDHAEAVPIPTLLAQVHQDSTTKVAAVQEIFDNIAAGDKRLHWIEGTTQRFQGYNYFSRNPHVMIDWFDARID